MARGSLAASAPLLLALAASASARPEYALREKRECSHCHINISAGFYTYRGMYYKLHNRSFARFDNVAEAKLAGVKPDAVGEDAAPTVPEYPDVKVPAALNFVVDDVQGKPVRLARYRGDVVLVVCLPPRYSNLPAYARLETLFARYREKGLTVLGFPEPGAPEPDAVPGKATLPRFAPMAAHGSALAPLYQFLTARGASPVDGPFAAFLIGRTGDVVGRFKAGADPLAPEVIAAVERALTTR